MSEAGANEVWYFPKSGLQVLIQVLQESGFDVIGPTVDQGAIVYGAIRTIEDLPKGITDIQEPGRYRLEKRNDESLFGYVVGPHSWKKFLFPPVSIVAAADRIEGHWQFSTPEESPRPFAFLGVRACELAAIRVQDQVFLDGPYVDAVYQRRRLSAFIVAVNCTQAASTCFCTSMKTGPRCQTGYDLGLTELRDGFLLEFGSGRGQQLSESLPLRPASESEVADGDRVRQQAADQIQRTLDTDGLADLLKQNLRSPHWEDVGRRCLSCTNCTMVCPTCFCSSVTEVADLTGDHVSRERRWDSCFNPEFSYMHSGIARDSIPSRYRQWLTHKLSSWHDQFGTSGCVGCGRCITWCPAGIDLTAEVSAIRGVTDKAESARTEDVP